jgi:hypothetical protein
MARTPLAVALGDIVAGVGARPQSTASDGSRGVTRRRVLQGGAAAIGLGAAAQVARLPAASAATAPGWWSWGPAWRG